MRHIQVPGELERPLKYVLESSLLFAFPGTHCIRMLAAPRQTVPASCPWCAAGARRPTGGGPLVRLCGLQGRVLCRASHAPARAFALHFRTRSLSRPAACAACCTTASGAASSRAARTARSGCTLPTGTAPPTPRCRPRSVVRGGGGDWGEGCAGVARTGTGWRPRRCGRRQGQQGGCPPLARRGRGGGKLCGRCVAL